MPMVELPNQPFWGGVGSPVSDDGIFSISLSADSKYLLSGSYDKTLTLWDAMTGRRLRDFEGHTGYVKSVSLSADGRYALSGSRDKTLKFWETDLYNAYKAELQITGYKGFEEIKKAQDEFLSAVGEAESMMKAGKYSNAFSRLYNAWKKVSFRDNKDMAAVYQQLYDRASARAISFVYCIYRPRKT